MFIGMKLLKQMILNVNKFWRQSLLQNSLNKGSLKMNLEPNLLGFIVYLVFMIMA